MRKPNAAQRTSAAYATDAAQDILQTLNRLPNENLHEKLREVLEPHFRPIAERDKLTEPFVEQVERTLQACQDFARREYQNPIAADA